MNRHPTTERGDSVRGSSPTNRVDLSWAITTFTWLVVLMLVAGVTGDPDLWGHLRFGLDALSQRTMPVIDPYSFTQDRPILYHEWLGAVVLAAVFHVGGFSALLILKLTVVLISFGVIWWAWRGVHPLARLAALVIAVLGAVPLTRTTRPQMWTLLLLLVLLWLLQRPPTPRRLIALGLLFVAWVNLHGGAILGLAVVGVWSLVASIQSWRIDRTIPWAWLLSPPVAVLVTLVNPYGADLWRFLLETVRPNRDITEWQPLWTAGAPIWVPFAIAAGATAVLRLWPSWPATAALFMLWFASLSVTRIAYLAVPATVLLAAPAAAMRWPRDRWRLTAPSRAAALVFSLPLLIVAWQVVPFVREPFACAPIGGQDRFGVARLSATTEHGRIAVWFDWGQYALWHLSPRLKVSWDGRRETLYSEHMQEIQRAVASGHAAGDQWLSAVRPEYVWLPAGFANRRVWLSANGYRVDHDTPTAFIAVRSDLPSLPDAAPFPECVRLDN